MGANEELSNLAWEILRLAQNKLLVQFSFLSGVLTSMDYLCNDAAATPEKLKDKEMISTDWEKSIIRPNVLQSCSEKITTFL